jgi:transposase
MSNTMLKNWIATTDLPRLMGVNIAELNRLSFLSAMDFVCREDKTSRQIHDYMHRIDDAIYQRTRRMNPLKPSESETVAYDLKSVLFFGISCPLAELRYNTKHIQQLQVNLALLVSKHDKCPITHFIYNGSRSSSSTIKNLVAQLKNTGIQPGTLIWDRGNVSKDYVEIVEAADWKLICGIPKNSKDVKKIIEDTDVPISPDSFVHKSKTGHI